MLQRGLLGRYVLNAPAPLLSIKVLVHKTFKQNFVEKCIVNSFKVFVQGYQPAFAQGKKSKNSPLKLMAHTCC